MLHIGLKDPVIPTRIPNIHLQVSSKKCTSAISLCYATIHFVL